MSQQGSRLATGWLELTVSTAGAQKSMTDEMTKAGDSAGASGSKSIGEQLVGGLKKYAGPIAAVVAGFSVAALIKNSSAAFMDLVGSVNALQRIAGGSKEEVSGLRASLQLSGVDADKASSALTIFSKNLGNAAADGESASEMAQKLGTDFLDAAGNVKPMSEILPGLADKFKSMPDGAEKTALATQLFGRSGAQMLPFLNKGSEGIAALTDKAKQMGLVIDDTSAKAFSAAKSSTREYTMSMQGLMVTIGGGVTPILTALQNTYRAAFIPIIQAATGFLQAHRGEFIAVSDRIQGFADKVGFATRVLLAFFTEGGSLGDMADGLGLNANSGIVMFLFSLREGAQAAFGTIRDTLGQIFSALAPAFAAILPTLGALIPQFLQLWTQISPLSLLLQALTPLLPTIASLFTTLGTSIASLLNTAVATLLPPLLDLATTLGGVLVQAAQSLLPVIVSLISSGLSTFISIIGTLLPVVSDLATTLGGVLGQAITSLMPVVSQIVSLLGGVLTQAISSLLPVFMQIVPIVGQVAGTLGGILGSVLQSLTPIIVLIATVFGQLLTALMPLIDVAFQLITPILGLITPILSLVSPLLSLVGAILQPLIQLFTALITPILQLITPLVSLLVPVLNVVVGILTWLVQGIVDVVTWLVQLVTGTGDAGNQLGAVWGFITTVFQTAIGLIVDTVGGFISNTIGMFVDFGTNVSNGVSTLWSNVTGWFSSGVSGIISFFTGLPGQILSALGNLGTLLLDAGQSLIQGFLDGINGMFGAIEDAVGGVMDFIGGFFPHSPAKRGPLSGSGWTQIRNSGLALGDQWAGGILAARPNVADVMTELTSGVPVPARFAPISPSIARATIGAVPGRVGGAGSGERPVAQIHVHPSEGMSEYTIGRVAANEISSDVAVATGGQ